VVGVLGSGSVANGFDLQGHRGARGLLPENTLYAFARALEIGVTTLELDVGVSRDDVVVVIHNPHLEPETTRSPDGMWLEHTGPAVRSLTVEQIKAYDVGRLKPGTRYAERYPDQEAVEGARVPTLEEVFELVERSGNKTVRFNIETKIRPEQPDLTPPPKVFARLVIDAAARHAVLDRVTIQSFDWRVLQAVQRQNPQVTTSYLSVNQPWFDTIRLGEAGASPWTAGFDVDDNGGSLPATVKKAGGDIWSSFHREVDRERVAEAHELGLAVKVWTVNEEAHMGALIDMGVDGIITDYPDRLRRVMAARGMALPQPTPVSVD